MLQVWKFLRVPMAQICTPGWPLGLANKGNFNFGPARTFTLSLFHTLKSLYFKAYFSFTWNLESPYTDLLQFKHKCTYFFATNLKNKQYTRWNTGETYKKLTRESYFFKTALHVFYIRDTFISNTGWDLIQNNNSQVS